jgi:hypothetical protein
VPGGRRPKTTEAVFEAYLQRALAPSLCPGQVVVMDNLSSHKGFSGARAHRDAGVRVGVLAALLARSQSHRRSIRQAHKALLRKAGSRTREALLEAMGRALDAVTANDARGFFEHRGYHVTAQPL